MIKRGMHSPWTLLIHQHVKSAKKGGETMRIVVMASGRGSNFCAIDAAIKSGELCAEIAAVVSDKADAPVVGKALDLGVREVAVLGRRGFTSRSAYNCALSDLVAGYEPDYIILAGFMKILGREFIDRFRGRIVNIHPSLLPSFPGLDAQKQALEHGVKVTGCTVHFVDEGTDTGPIILQKAVPVFEDDDEGTLSARILEEEHKLCVEALKLLADGMMKIEGRRAVKSG
jgi:phosphoribosylglycinamide formyltransferase-1